MPRDAQLTKTEDEFIRIILPLLRKYIHVHPDQFMLCESFWNELFYNIFGDAHEGVTDERWDLLFYSYDAYWIVSKWIRQRKDLNNPHKDIFFLARRVA